MPAMVGYLNHWATAALSRDQTAGWALLTQPSISSVVRKMSTRLVWELTKHWEICARLTTWPKHLCSTSLFPSSRKLRWTFINQFDHLAALNFLTATLEIILGIFFILLQNLTFVYYKG
ncbi:hypothetical protein TNCV_118371 [Trichonephila clavipes]|nr:hypothetical protein TNCV_118371 [Trichonephila clavipes]